MFTNVAFHPRPDTPGSSRLKDVLEVHDGTYAGCDAGVKVGYRLYPLAGRSRTTPLLITFHGNAELCSDADYTVQEWQKLGVSVLSVDFRGYGWGTGKASLLKLTGIARATARRTHTLTRASARDASSAACRFRCTGDAGALLPALPDILAKGGLTAESPLVLLGRSIGSTCAVHLAATHPDKVRCRSAAVRENGGRGVRADEGWLAPAVCWCVPVRGAGARVCPDSDHGDSHGAADGGHDGRTGRHAARRHPRLLPPSRRPRLLPPATSPHLTGAARSSWSPASFGLPLSCHAPCDCRPRHVSASRARRRRPVPAVREAGAGWPEHHAAAGAARRPRRDHPAEAGAGRCPPIATISDATCMRMRTRATLNPIGIVE